MRTSSAKPAYPNARRLLSKPFSGVSPGSNAERQLFAPVMEQASQRLAGTAREVVGADILREVGPYQAFGMCKDAPCIVESCRPQLVNGGARELVVLCGPHVAEAPIDQAHDIDASWPALGCEDLDVGVGLETSRELL